MKMEKIIEIGIALSSEQNYTKLLDSILFEAMNVTRADAGTLYVLDEGELRFHIMRNISMDVQLGLDGTQVNFPPPVPLEEKYVCAYAALHKQVINIANVYESGLFDFCGPQDYDRLTGYRTNSMLVVPLCDNEKNLIGVLQLINAIDENGHITEFDDDRENLVTLLSSFSAIALTNLKHDWDIKRLLFSFLNVIVTAVDERTPFNASHTHRIVEMLLSVIDFIRKTPWAVEIMGEFNESREESIMMCAWLHDIGKLVTPINIMNKATRLGDGLSVILNRMDMIQILGKIELLSGHITQDEWDRLVKDTVDAGALVTQIDTARQVDDELREKVNQIAKRTYKDWYGQTQPWLTQNEADCLLIKNGTLTAQERRVMEQHAEITVKLLSKVAFSPRYGNVTKWAGSHHEKLDGTGYPDGLKSESLSVEVRLLTVLDIFEALTTDERPYKSAVSPDDAFNILYSMADDKKLDRDVIRVLQESRAWEHPGDAATYFDNRMGFCHKPARSS